MYAWGKAGLTVSEVLSTHKIGDSCLQIFRLNEIQSNENFEAMKSTENILNDEKI